MDRRRIKSLGLLFACAVTAALMVQWRFGGRTEHERVRARYEQLRAAMRAGDTNLITLLLLPEVRARTANEMVRLQTFAHDFSGASFITVNGAQAWICPRRELPFIPFLRIGHEIEMRRVEGEWYLTGKISIW